MNQSIFCTVNNCIYWVQGNVCSARDILVSTDEFGNNQKGGLNIKELSATPSGGSGILTACMTYKDHMTGSEFR